ncbi:PIN domain-containing protein [Candidatus Woesearchaeota archaeon]|nr:PIN domain-containing protein [Candidatus Woesearchaeota archaeon]
MENIFIDTNSFISFLTDDKEKADKIENIISDKNKEIYTSYNVLNEVKFIMLIDKAMKVLKTDKKGELIKFIKNNEEIRNQIMEKYLQFYANIKYRIKILMINDDAEILSCKISIDHGLLPTDASIAAMMKLKGIKKILTRDSDFKKVNGIEVIEV